MLEASHVSKTYTTAAGPLPILADVSLSLAQGDAIAIVGPSGTGKSTLLYILGALESPDGGSVKLDGVDPFVMTSAARKHVPAPANIAPRVDRQHHRLRPELLR